MKHNTCFEYYFYTYKSMAYLYIPNSIYKIYREYWNINSIKQAIICIRIVLITNITK